MISDTTALRPSGNAPLDRFREALPAGLDAVSSEFAKALTHALGTHAQSFKEALSEQLAMDQEAAKPLLETSLSKAVAKEPAVRFFLRRVLALKQNAHVSQGDDKQQAAAIIDGAYDRALILSEGPTLEEETRPIERAVAPPPPPVHVMPCHVGYAVPTPTSARDAFMEKVEEIKTAKKCSFSHAWEEARNQRRDLWDEWVTAVDREQIEKERKTGGKPSKSGVPAPPRPVHDLPCHSKGGWTP